jgi:hypothetical protein
MLEVVNGPPVLNREAIQKAFRRELTGLLNGTGSG